MQNSNGNNTIKWRVTQLEKGQESIDSKLDKITTNDLPHLHEGMSSLKTRMSVLTAVNVGAIILALVVSKFM